MSDQMLQSFREDAEQAVPPCDFGAIERRGARRRFTRRAAGTVAVAAVLATVGSLAFRTDGPAPSPAPAVDPGLTGYPLIEERSDGRIPPGRSELPALTRSSPDAAVTVLIPDAARGWGENIDHSGTYSTNRQRNGYLHLAAYVVDGVAENICERSSIPPAGSVSGFGDPGPTTQDLANAIADLPRGKVLSPPRTVEKWGTTAIHVRVQMARTVCQNGNRPFMFDTATGGESIGNLHAVLDFWVVRVNDQRLVVEAEAPMSATRGERLTLARMVASVQLHSL